MMKSNNGTITIAFKGGCFLLVAPVVPCCTRYAHEKNPPEACLKIGLMSQQVGHRNS